MAENIRIEAYFSGHVQGVGFRFTALDIADRFPAIVGFVRNMRDGRVELVVEGPDPLVNAFLTAIADSMGPFIHGVQKKHLPATGEFVNFTIAR